MPVLFLAYIAIAYAAFRHPYVVLICLILASRFGDSFGLGSFLARSMFAYHDVALASLTILASIVCTYSFFKREKCLGLNPRRCALLIGAAYFFCLWIFLSSILQSRPYGNSYTQVLLCQAYAIPIVVRYSQSRKFRIALMACVFAQLLVAATMLLFPSSPLGIMATARYKDITVAPYEQFEGLARYYGSRKLAAQFFNSNSYGFYATSSIVMSFAVLNMIKRRVLAIPVFVAMLGLALFAQVSTMARGCLWGLFFGCVLGLFAWLRLARFKVVPLFGVAAFGFLLLMGAGLVARDSELRSALFPDVQSRDVVNRTGAVGEAIGLIEADPLLGNGDPEAIGLIAHVTPFFFAEVYGIPASLTPLLMMVLVAATYLVVIARRRRDLFPPDARVPYLLDFVAGMVGMGMWMSNGSGGMLNWIIITLAIVPWLRVPSQKSAWFREPQQVRLNGPRVRPT